MFDRVLIANRGEIAVRVIRTCRRLGITTVAVYSDADEKAPHVQLADEAVRLGPAPVRDSYLNLDALLRLIEAARVDAVHPGYGLLSERAEFAERVAAQGVVFVGPPPAALEAFGDKIRARAVARAAGVEPPPGTEGPLDPEDEAVLAAEAGRIGFPLLVKAAGGGGGIGMQVVHEPSGVAKAATTCANRGRAAFGDARVYLERYLESPRHIEVQVLCDRHGSAAAVGERECSVQRRHQKVIEEAPSPASFFQGSEGQARRDALYGSALAVVGHVGYEGAGTVEFVADGEGRLYFLEVNARLQVEHPVTEMTTGLDLVEHQLRVASGEALAGEVREAEMLGHAIEARLYAEDPDKKFVPQPGRLARLRWPTGEGIRVDSGFEQGGEVTVHYDPLIAKMIAHGADRPTAIERLDRALAQTELTLEGPKGPRRTNLDFCRRVLSDARFVSGSYDTALAESVLGTRK